MSARRSQVLVRQAAGLVAGERLGRKRLDDMAKGATGMSAGEGHLGRVRLALAAIPSHGTVALHEETRPFEIQPTLPFALVSALGDSHRWPIRPDCRLPLESGG